MSFLDEAEIEHEKMVMLDTRLNELRGRSRAFLNAFKQCPARRWLKRRRLYSLFNITWAEHVYVQRLFDLTYCKTKRFLQKHEELYGGTA